MKVSKLLSLDYELVNKLKQEENASALVNQLLANHYKDPRTEEQIIKEVKKKINKKAQEKIDKEIMKEKIDKRVAEMKKNKRKNVKFGDVNDN